MRLIFEILKKLCCPNAAKKKLIDQIVEADRAKSARQAQRLNDLNQSKKSERPVPYVGDFYIAQSDDRVKQAKRAINNKHDTANPFVVDAAVVDAAVRDSWFVDSTSDNHRSRTDTSDSSDSSSYSSSSD